MLGCQNIENKVSVQSLFRQLICLLLHKSHNYSNFLLNINKHLLKFKIYLKHFNILGKIFSLKANKSEEWCHQAMLSPKQLFIIQAVATQIHKLSPISPFHDQSKMLPQYQDRQEIIKGHLLLVECVVWDKIKENFRVLSRKYSNSQLVQGKCFPHDRLYKQIFFQIISDLS